MIARDSWPPEARRLLEAHVRARAELPELLTRLAEAGREAEALAALVAWGTGRRPVLEIWEDARRAAAALEEARRCG